MQRERPVTPFYMRFAVRRHLCGCCFTLVLARMALVGQPGGAYEPNQPPGSVSAAEGSIGDFLRNYLGTPREPADKTARYVARFVDLNGDGMQEAVVYVIGRDWCGSGGCLTLVLARTESSYRVVTRITISRPPILAFTTTSNGWRSLGV